MTTQKTAYIWGPVTSFNGPLAAYLVKRGWHVHFACKSSLSLLSLSPLDLKTQAQNMLYAALGGKENERVFKDRLKVVEPTEAVKHHKYDAIIFSALPPNFDEARSPRAPLAGADFKAIMKAFRGTPTFIISSIWGGVQKDGVVPEELEFVRRKSLSNWEGICQQYEQRILENLAGSESPWYLVRLPLLSGDTKSGESIKYDGIYTLLKEIVQETSKPFFPAASLKLAYNPDSTLWFLPVDVAVSTFFHYIEDEGRPRICNLVSTQMTLNREWLTHLAESLNCQEIICSEQDGLNLPGTLRKLLLDDVQVKTRNLFEVAGRYQMPPMRLDKDYFDKMIQSGKSHNWGEHVALIDEPSVLDYSEQLAHYYFEKFVPERIEHGALKDAKINGTSIGFHLRAGSVHGWLLRSKGTGETEVVPFDPTLHKPDICFHFSGTTLSRLIQNKMQLQRAVIMREVEAQGNLFQLWRITSTIDKFLRENPVVSKDVPELAQIYAEVE